MKSRPPLPKLLNPSVCLAVLLWMLAFLNSSVFARTTAAVTVRQSHRAMSSVSTQELKIRCSDGLVLAGQRYKSNESSGATKTKYRILCLHGWMDNCRSYHHLAPVLVEDKPHVDVVALDFVGHGHSSHKSLDGTHTVLAESVYHVREALHQLGWIVENKDEETSAALPSPQVILVGHSMGAGVSCLYSAAFPEHVHKLVLLEGAAPMERPPQDIAKHIRSHVDRRMRLTSSLAEGDKPPRIYPSLEAAVRTRCLTAKNFPGNQWLSTEAGTELVLWGTEPVGEEGGVRFRHDVRLQWPSCMYITKEQANAVYSEINCPTALFLAKDGWPFDEARMQEAMKLLKPTLFDRTLPGSHHFHADPESAPAVARKVVEFLQLNA